MWISTYNVSLFPPSGQIELWPIPVGDSMFFQQLSPCPCNACLHLISPFRKHKHFSLSVLFIVAWGTIEISSIWLGMSFVMLRLITTTKWKQHFRNVLSMSNSCSGVSLFTWSSFWNSCLRTGSLDLIQSHHQALGHHLLVTTCSKSFSKSYPYSFIYQMDSNQWVETCDQEKREHLS